MIFIAISGVHENKTGDKRLNVNSLKQDVSLIVLFNSGFLLLSNQLITCYL